MDATVAAGWIGAGAAILGTMAGSLATMWATVRTLRPGLRRSAGLSDLMAVQVIGMAVEFVT